ncbi:MAG TPA: ankyrin repeat domain-containing protein [Cyclobacteriaceae bacterium]|nr:ankyrin repeat domain-containing protein [Cyclobacteriaceae bacterium]
MKTVTFSIRLLCVLGIIIVLISCGGNKTEESSSASTTKTPEVDIHTAVVTDNLEALKQHIAAGTNINEKDPFGGSSPLISASVFGKPEAAKILLDAGADVNFQNNDGSTALHTAAFFCHKDIVAMLLEKGADKSLRNKFNATAYESVSVPFKDVKDAYDMMGNILGPMGLKLDYAHIEKTRPEIAEMLK